MADVAAEGAYWDPVAVKARRSAEADAQAARARRRRSGLRRRSVPKPPDFREMYPKMHASLGGETNGEPKAKAKKPFEMQPRSHGGSTRVTV